MGIINELKGTLASMAAKSSGKLKGNQTWTQEIKRCLCDLGSAKGYSVATSGFGEEFEGEWLYDLVWYVENENKMLVSVPLVMESEWEPNLRAVKFDFEKLLLANAELRLMICQCNISQTDEYLNYFKNAIISYEHGGKEDLFLIAILDTSTELFSFHLFKRNDLLI